MLKLRGYLKPFILATAAAIVLLFVQAISDLNLPNLMSGIVTVSIQHQGVENAAPEIMTENAARLVKIFMTDAQKSLFDANYAESGGKFTRGASTAELDGAFNLAYYTMIDYMRSLSDQNGGAGNGAQDLADMDISALYAYLPMLEMLPQEQIAPHRELAERTDAALTSQIGVFVTRLIEREAGVDIRARQTAYFIREGLIMLLVALASGIAAVLVGFLSSRIASGVAKNIRRDVFNKVQSFSNAEYDRFGTASLITRATNDITQIQMLITMGLRMMCFAPIMGIGGIIMALEKSVSMSWVIGVAVLSLLGLIAVMLAVAMPKFKAIQKLIDRLNLVSREGLTGMTVIRAFGTRDHEKERFAKANGELTDTMRFVNRAMVTMMPFMTLIMSGVSLLIVWVGGHYIEKSLIQVGDMMAYIQYAMQIIFSFLMVAMMFVFVPRAAVAGDRIYQVLSAQLSIADPENPKELDPQKRGELIFDDVSFRYGGAEEDALRNISFSARPGEVTALIGSTGSGKSTVANLIMRFYDVTGGKITLSGVDIREVTQETLRSKIGYVPQKGVLMTGTIASNIAYGAPEADDEQILAAAGIAQAADFVDEKGLDGEIAQGGTNVSGGQKQRLSIARALARKPEVLIFDDSFSALDFRTDAALRAALRPHIVDSAMIVVAQRVNTIMNADRIIVLEHGEIVGDGKHAELLKTCGQYREIAASQLSEEELGL